MNVRGKVCTCGHDLEDHSYCSNHTALECTVITRRNNMPDYCGCKDFTPKALDKKLSVKNA